MGFTVDYITEEEHGDTTFTYNYPYGSGNDAINNYQGIPSNPNAQCPIVPDNPSMGVCKQTFTVDFSDFLSKAPHAGIYLFELTQIEDYVHSVNIGDVNKNMIESKSVYEVRVYVKNNSGYTGYEIDYITITQTKDDDGVDLADTNGDYPKTSTILFKSAWDSRYPLEISKVITGDYANMFEAFDFEVTLLNPGMTTSTFTGKIVDANNTFVSTVSVPVGTTTSFQLKHGWKLVFENDTINSTTALPVGTQYITTELFSDGYTPEVRINGSTNPATTTDDGSGNISHSAVAIASSSNTAAWTNVYRLISPTGIIINKLPYILLVVVSIGGFVGYIMLKRRQAKKQ